MKPLCLATKVLKRDSIDALEIILILEREYGIKIENPSEGKQIFYSVRTLADYIIANRKA